MAMENIGLGGTLTFNNGQAVAAMEQTKAQFTKVQTATEAASASFPNLGTALASAAQLAKPAVEALKNSVAGIGPAVKSSTDKIAPGIAQVKAGFAMLGQEATKAIPGLSSAVNTIRQGILKIGDVFVPVGAKVSAGMEAIKQKFASVGPALAAGVAKLSPLLNPVRQAFGALGNVASAAMKKIGPSVQGVKLIVSGLGNMVKQAATSMMPSIDSIKTRFASIGGAITSGMAKITPAVQGVISQLGKLGGAAGAALGRLKPNFDAMAGGFSKIGGSLRGATMAAAPLAVGMAFGTKKAIDFESAMGRVGNQTGATAEQYKIMNLAARRAALTTSFGADVTAGAMEQMGVEGAKANDIIGAMPALAAMASTRNLQLGDAVGTVVDITKAMGGSFSDAADLTNVLTMASVKATVPVQAIGDAFRSGGPVLADMGFQTKELAGAFAMMADKGIAGSRAGMSLANIMANLTKPTGKTADLMAAWGVKTTDAAGNMKPISKIITELTGHIEGIGNAAHRTSAITTIFGAGGRKAYSALSEDGGKALTQLTADLQTANDGTGFAAQLNEKRMKTFSRSFEAFTRVIGAFALDVMMPMLEPFAGAIQAITKQVSNLVYAFQALREGVDENGKPISGVEAITARFGATTVAVAQGIMDALTWMKETWDTVVKTVTEFGKKAEDAIGAEKIRAIAKWAVILAAIVSAAAPVLAMLGAIAFVVTSVVIPAISGIASVVSAAFWPVLAVLAAVYIAFQLLKEPNESFLDTVVRVWGAIKAWALDVYNNVLKPIWQGMKDAWEGIGPVVTEVWNSLIQTIGMALTTIGELFGSATGDMQINWREVGQTIASVIGAIMVAVVTMVEYTILILMSLVKAVWTVGKMVYSFLSTPFIAVYNYVQNLKSAFADIFGGNLIRGIAKIGLAIADFLLMPIQALVRTIISFAEAIPGVEVPKGLKTFAEKGLTGLLFPTIEEAKTAANAPAEQAKAVTEAKAQEKKAAQTPPVVQANIKLEDKRVTEVKTNVHLDTEKVWTAQGRHQQEIQERAGFKSTPWQRRMALEHGAVPVKG